MRLRTLLVVLISVACGRSEQQAVRNDASSTEAAATPNRPEEARRVGCGDPIIRKQGVGNIAIGDPVDSLTKCNVVRDTVVLEDEGGKARKVFVALAADTIAAQIVDGRVWRIEVSSPGIRTADSLGVGTPLRRLLEMSSPRGVGGEGRMFVLSPDHCGQSFEIPYFASPRGDWTRHLAELPDGTHVIRVLVARCYPQLY